jgi:hypothetical protein
MVQWFSDMQFIVKRSICRFPTQRLFQPRRTRLSSYPSFLRTQHDCFSHHEVEERATTMTLGSSANPHTVSPTSPCLLSIPLSHCSSCSYMNSATSSSTNTSSPNTRTSQTHANKPVFATGNPHPHLTTSPSPSSRKTFYSTPKHSNDSLS